MATYMELKQLYNNSDLQDKTEVACIVAAEAISVDASPPANQAARLDWAAATCDSPRVAGARMLMLLLAGNKDQEVVDIIGATDAAIQTKVDAAVDLFTNGG